MATNTFNNVAHITQAAMNVVKNNLVLVPRVNRTYETEFDGANKIGDTVNVRIPGYGTSTSGKVAVPTGFQDSYKPITVSQRNASLRFSSKELALNVAEGAEFERSVLGPQMAKLINDIDYDGFALFDQIPNATGTPATAPTDLQYFLEAQAVLAEHSAPVDDEIYGILSPRTQASMVQGLKGLFADTSEISSQYKKGVMGMAAGMHFLMSQNIINHQTGTWTGTPLINDAGAALATGATTIPVDGFGGATDTYEKGDIITIANVYSVNPVSKISTGQLMQFTVTADTAAAASAMATLPISPTIYTSASGPLQNVTALPLDGAAVKVFAAVTTYSNKISPANLVLHRDCLGFACKDLPQTVGRDLQSRVRDKDLGLSIRVTKGYDTVNDEVLIRLDVLYGWAVLRPDFGCRVQG